MAESTLSLGFADFQREVGHYLGFGYDPDNYSSDQTSEVDFIVQSGYRRFLNPPLVPGESVSHEWNFLSPVASLSVLSATDPADYDMPDDFGSLVGSMSINTANILNSPITQIPEGKLRSLRADETTSSYSFRPQYVAIRPKAGFDGTTGTRYEALIYPQPDANYTLNYKYNVLVGKLSTSAPYPLGGASRGELVLQSCLSIAEQRRDEASGVQTQLFYEMLKAAVDSDRAALPDTFGYVGDGSDKSNLSQEDLYRRQSSIDVSALTT